MLHCVAVGDPTPVVRWDKNNRVSSFDPQRFKVAVLSYHIYVTQWLLSLYSTWWVQLAPSKKWGGEFCYECRLKLPPHFLSAVNIFNKTFLLIFTA